MTPIDKEILDALNDLNVNVEHKTYGKGNMIAVNSSSETDIRIFVEWENKEIMHAGWYDHDDPNLEIE